MILSLVHKDHLDSIKQPVVNANLYGQLIIERHSKKDTE